MRSDSQLIGHYFTTLSPTITRANFSGRTVDLHSTEFSGGAVRFSGARFSGGRVDFSDAHDWSFPLAFSWTDTPPSDVKLPKLI